MSLSRPFFSQRITQQRGHELAVRLKMGISEKPVATSALTLALAETGSVPCQTRNEGGRGEAADLRALTFSVSGSP